MPFDSFALLENRGMYFLKELSDSIDVIPKLTEDFSKIN
jgi:hypothetical protein